MADQIWKRSPSKRPDKIASTAQRVLAELVLREVKDPRLGSHVTVLKVEMAKDLRNATVLFSSMDIIDGTNSQDKARIRELETAFKMARSFLARRLAQEMNLKFVPELRFRFAQFSETSGSRVGELLRSIKEKESDDSTE